MFGSIPPSATRCPGAPRLPTVSSQEAQTPTKTPVSLSAEVVNQVCFFVFFLNMHYIHLRSARAYWAYCCTPNVYKV